MTRVSPLHRRLPRSTARGQIVAVFAAVVILTGTIVAGLTWAVLTLRDNQRIDRDLAAVGASFVAFADTAVDPATGEPFVASAQLMRAAIDRDVPSADETRFALVNGVVTARSTRGYPGRIDQDEDLLDQLAVVDEPVIATAHTDAGRVRYIAVPVSGADGDGVYVAAVAREAAARQVGQIVGVLVLVGALGVGVAAALGWLVAGRVLAPLDRLRQAAADISAHDLDLRIPETGTADIRDLTRSFNTMLDRLDRAFNAQRRFAADAGHELRTPLTILRGHTELLSAEPQIRAGQQALLLDEIDRMSAMVEDLLALTRLDSGRTAAVRVSFEDLDTSVVIDQWAQLTQALEPRSWTWISDGGTIRADPHRLRQVFLQLVENALAVTARGDAVEVGLVADPSPQLWVADSGPGISPEERERIFEPFARGTARTPGGSGLGLAIVASIARAHGGWAQAVAARPVERADPWPGGACIVVALAPTPQLPSARTIEER